jgi:hypothetical protein
VFGRCTIPYVYKLLKQLLGSMGINLRLDLVTIAEYGDQLFNPEMSVINLDLDEDLDELEQLEAEVGEEDGDQDVDQDLEF